MSNETFWVMIGSLGQCAGALATFIAVCVALWQTKYANRKKIKLVFEDLVAGIYNGAVEHAIGVTITNVGNKPIIISQFSLMYTDEKMMIIFQENQGVFSKRMPITINPEENTTLHYTAEVFVTHVNALIAEHKLEKNKRIPFRIKDSVGKEYWVKSKGKADVYTRRFW